MVEAARLPGASVTIDYSMAVTLAGDGILTGNKAVRSGSTRRRTRPCGGVAGACADRSLDRLDQSPADPSDAASFVVDQVITSSFVVTNTETTPRCSPIQGVSEVAFDGAAGAMSAIVTAL